MNQLFLTTATVRRTAARFGALLTGALVLTLFSLHAPLAMAQGGPTSVPALVPSFTPTILIVPTPTPSRTPVENISTIRVEAKERANVRTAPDLEAQVITQIFPGQTYPVLGRRAKWFQIRFERALTGLAWVYEDVVNVVGGDAALIPEIGVDEVPTANLETAAAQLTAEYLTATPGAPASATAARASATGVSMAAAPATLAPGEAGPTFTYPPPFVEATLPTRISAVSGGGLPPIAPIAGLFSLGLLGLLVAALRRGR
jgi:hypothetical protein